MLLGKLVFILQISFAWVWVYQDVDKGCLGLTNPKQANPVCFAPNILSLKANLDTPLPDSWLWAQALGKTDQKSDTLFPGPIKKQFSH
jgi:hypothetical protein